MRLPRLARRPEHPTQRRLEQPAITMSSFAVSTLRKLYSIQYGFPPPIWQTIQTGYPLLYPQLTCMKTSGCNHNTEGVPLVRGQEEPCCLAHRIQTPTPSGLWQHMLGRDIQKVQEHASYHSTTLQMSWAAQPMGQQKHLRGSSRTHTTAPTRDTISSRGMAMMTSSHCHQAPPFGPALSFFPSAGFSSSVPGLTAAAALAAGAAPNLSACNNQQIISEYILCH